MGQTFANLTKAGPTQAVEAARASRIDTGGLPSVSGTVDAPVFGQAAEPMGSTPEIKAPSFAEAKPENLTTKGKIFGMVLSAAQGALLGDPRTSEGYRRASLFPNQQRAAQLQIENDELQNEINRQNLKERPMLFGLGVKSKQAEIDKDVAQTGYFNAGTNKREKTQAELDAERAAAADASGYPKGSREYNQVRFGNPLDPKERNRSPYDDFAAKFPDTPEGRYQAAVAYKAEKPKNPSRADRLDDLKADAELDAVDYLQRAGGDPNKAIALVDDFVRQNAKGENAKQIATLAQFIRDSLRQRSRVSTGSGQPEVKFNDN